MARKRQDKRTRSPAAWEHLPDETILGWRVRDLGLRMSDSWLQESVTQLHEELARQGLAFRPTCYLADEWFCPDKVPVIGIPFCLAHPRLIQIEQRMMDEVEGGTPETCIRLLRHECGHAINYAYGLYRRTRWRELFGSFSTSYPTNYDYRPYSRHYVVHLEDGYAQSHPDEDFAETFAVWLAPDSHWPMKYEKWPVIRKLRYVDALMKGIAQQSPSNTARDMPYAADRMTSTLATYYERKRKSMGEQFLGYYDDALQVLFAAGPGGQQALRAASLLRRNRRSLVDNTTAWSAHRKYDINLLLTRLARRCDVLDLYVREPEQDALVAFTAFLSAVMSKTLRFNPNERRA